MSSSDDAAGEAPAPAGDPPYGWDVFAPRPAPAAMDVRPPATEMVAVLQRYRAALGAERGRAAAEVDRAMAIAVEQAVLVHRFAGTLARLGTALEDAGLGLAHRELRILRSQMAQSLRDGGVDVRDPVGLPPDEVADLVEVIGWRYGAEFEAEAVAETVDPIVLVDGAVARTGRVHMGAPPETPPEPAEPTAPDEADEPTAPDEKVNDIGEQG
ncbi:hypothetical protein [Actinomadura sp. 9N215]|uniref:hypothetical protein n=1 Tax=Actinomadura sp. 9N215 TaxID=3375150 RepID=UPI00378C17B0